MATFPTLVPTKKEDLKGRKVQAPQGLKLSIRINVCERVKALVLKHKVNVLFTRHFGAQLQSCCYSIAFIVVVILAQQQQGSADVSLLQLETVARLVKDYDKGETQLQHEKAVYAIAYGLGNTPIQNWKCIARKFAGEEIKSKSSVRYPADASDIIEKVCTPSR